MVKIIENYALHEQIGEGEYGKVFRGIDSRTKQEVAVKVINVKKFKEYPKLEECTLNEIEVLSKIESPHIVRFIEILKTANNFYFFYEFCNQGTLEELIKSKGTLTESEALEYFSQILEAFKILNSKNIMHRDLKPSNILVNDGIIKIADFGFCKSLENQGDLAQTMLGSPIYMAPEVLKGEIYTIKADIWSLGVVVYEMLYGFCPFEERSIARLINLLEKEDLTFNPQINRISAAFEDLLRRMMMKDHFKRIGWKDILDYKINGKPILKSVALEKEEKTKERSVSIESESLRPLEEAKNFMNIIEKPVGRPSIDYNYHDISGNKSTSQAIATTAPSGQMFKKNSQNSKPTPLSCIENTQQGSNKENIMSKETQEQSSVKKNKNFRTKLKHYLKLASEIIEFNYCPEITLPLCLKLYQTLQKEILKSEDTLVTNLEKQSLNQIIKQFQEEQIKYGSCPSISGPLLNYYIKTLQLSHRECFQLVTENKEMIIHCLNLLNLNEIGNKNEIIWYNSFSKEKLVSELYQKILKNVI